MLAEETRKREVAERERDELRQRLDDRFPNFEANLWEIHLQDPPTPPDLTAFLIVAVSNFGAPSCISGWEVSVKAVNGSTIDVDVFYAEEFRLITNKFNSQIRYKAEHFITQRTMLTPVVPGTPVFGALPVIFRGVTDIDKINFESLKIRFADAIGNKTRDGLQWWEVSPPKDIRIHDIMTPKKRIGMPSIEPRTLL